MKLTRFLLLATIIGLGLGLYYWRARAAVPEGAVVVEGFIRKRAQLPDPRSAAYKDALFTAEVAVDRVWSGTDVPSKILVAFPGFLDRKPTPCATLETNQRVHLVLIRFENVSEDIASLQRVDENDDFTLEFYYAARTRRIRPSSQRLMASPSGRAPEKPLPAFPTNPFAVTPEESQKRREDMRRDREHIDQQLAAHGGDWSAWYEELHPQRESLRRQLAAHDGLLVKEPYSFNDLACMEYSFDPESRAGRNLVAALTALNRVFRAYGADLIVAPVPERDLVSAAQFLDDAPADGILQPYALRIVKTLLEANIEVLDFLPDLLGKAATSPLMYFYDSPDIHPADGAILAMAEALARRISRYELSWPREDFDVVEKAYRGPRLYPQLSQPFEKRAWRFQGRTGRNELDAESPILCLGDSFAVSPQGYVTGNYGLPWHLAAATGIRPALFIRKSSALMFLRYMAREDQARFQGRKVCIFVTHFGNLSRAPEQWEVLDLFAERHQAAKTAAIYEAGKPVLRLEEAAALADLRIVPEAGGDPVKIGAEIPADEQPRRVLFPEFRANAARQYAVKMVTKADLFGTWEFRFFGSAPQPVVVTKGYAHFLWIVKPGPGGDWWGLEIPATAKPVAIESLEVREITP